MFSLQPYLSRSLLLLYGIQILFILSMCSLWARGPTSDPQALDLVISGPRDLVCVCVPCVCMRGLIISWPHSPFLHHLTLIIILEAIKHIHTHTLTCRSTNTHTHTYSHKDVWLSSFVDHVSLPKKTGFIHKSRNDLGTEHPKTSMGNSLV